MEVIVDPVIKAKSNKMFAQVSEALTTSGYEIRFARTADGRGKANFRKHKEFRTAPQLSKVLNAGTKLLVIWWTKRTRNIAQNVAQNFNVPTILLHKGILPGTWLCDTGMLGDSVLVRGFPGVLEACLDDEYRAWSKKYSEFIVRGNVSRREQSKSQPKLPEKFVFLPMQYMDDVSIKDYCPITYPEFFEKVAHFCAIKKLPLVVKQHPDMSRWKSISSEKPKQRRKAEIDKVNALVVKFRKKFGCNIIISDGSIHWFCQKCTFMAGMNTTTHIDAIMNQIISFHTGGSLFSNSNAVVHDNNIERGLEKCLTMSSEEKDRLIRYQQAVLYYLYNRHSLVSSDSRFSSELSNVQKFKNLVRSI